MQSWRREDRVTPTHVIGFEPRPRFVSQVLVQKFQNRFVAAISSFFFVNHGFIRENNVLDNTPFFMLTTSDSLIARSCSCRITGLGVSQIRNAVYCRVHCFRG